MDNLNNSIFIQLFQEVCEKCFGFPLTSPLSETDSKLLSNDILDKTGLVIGAKSIKNYSFYVLKAQENRRENPSVATLDTLARYVLEAPYTDETQRKDKEAHYPYWFQYRSKSLLTTVPSQQPTRQINRKRLGQGILLILVLLLGAGIMFFFLQNKKGENFTESFQTVDEDSLRMKGWMLHAKDPAFWKLRKQKTGHLSLYTLRGDNWANAQNPADIRNLLMRQINSECFEVEIHLSNFIPRFNWQQAGILLSEDSTFSNKTIRLSIAYNDFFGGYQKSPEIIIQGISSSESGKFSKPEEVVHFPIFNLESGNEKLVKNNLAKSALKIEKKGNHFRFLYTTSPTESFAFKEILSRDFSLNPRYVGIFAIQGWADRENAMAADFDLFRWVEIPCR